MYSAFAESSRLGLGRWRSVCRGWVSCFPGGNRWGDNTCTVRRGFVLFGWKNKQTNTTLLELIFYCHLFLCIKCIRKYNLKNSMSSSWLYVLIYQNAGIPFRAAWLETDALDTKVWTRRAYWWHLGCGLYLLGSDGKSESWSCLHHLPKVTLGKLLSHFSSFSQWQWLLPWKTPARLPEGQRSGKWQCVCGLQTQRPSSLLSVALFFFFNFEEVGSIFWMAALPLFKISNPAITSLSL